MVARFGFNKNGAEEAWRCYGELKETSETNACLGNDFN
jgi:hypothetical protein